MKIVIIGYGVQGRKRQRVAGGDAIGTVDPNVAEADWRDIRDVHIDRYSAAAVCTPDAAKLEILRYLLDHGKHVLVEKPLQAASADELLKLEGSARRRGAVCYTAYNHRFEPHFVRMRDLVRTGVLGKIYRCRMFYGNGTARLVRDSAWRDTGAGVLLDLGSHLLDTARFWFGDLGDDFRLVSIDRFENRSADHAVIAIDSSRPALQLEVTLLSWRNHFTCDIFAECGSAHIESLCKWGPTTFTHRRRLLPSGIPPAESITLAQEDPTWALEYDHFKALIASRAETDMSGDLWLHRVLADLSAEAQTGVGA
jgi:scyllo-inositol 2-dehydrogenase (NADP+)